MGKRGLGGASEPPDSVRRLTDSAGRAAQRRSGVRVKNSRDVSLSENVRAREKQRRDLSRDWLAEGLTALRRDDLARALACFTSARSLDGGSKETAFYAAWVQLQLAPSGPGSEVVQNLARAMLLENPQHAFAHYVTGEIARRRGDSGAARRSLTTAIQLDPELAAARAALEALLSEQSA